MTEKNKAPVTLSYPNNVETSSTNSTFLSIRAIQPFSYFDMQGEKDGLAGGGAGRDAESSNGGKTISDTWRKYKTIRESGKENSFDMTKTSSSIHLYMPNLLVNTSHEYNDTSISWAGQLIDMKKAFSKGNSVGEGGLVGMIGGMVESAGSGLAVAQKLLISGLDAASGGAIGQSQGQVANPKATTMYKGTSLRQQTFNFQLKPSNMDEVKTVHNMIRELRGYSSASINGESLGFAEIEKKSDWLKVPHFWFLEELISNSKNRVSPNREMFKFGPAVLTSIRTNYTPDQYWVLFKSGDPVYIDLELQFSELMSLTREDIMGKADFDGKINDRVSGL